MEPVRSAAELANRALELEASIGVIPLLPLLGSIVVALCISLRNERQWQAGWIATIFAAGSFVWTVFLFGQLDESVDALTAVAWQWFQVGELDVSFAFRFDRLAAVMTLVVTGVGSLIHLYAIGYMEHDSSRPRFFCYLNLFLFAMLMLVLADNLLVLFVGWEGVGLCSYLLIGFWFSEMDNAKAGQKAFVVNRIGDAGFLLGMFILFWFLGSVSFTEISAGARAMPIGWLEAAALLLFVGAVGKSAQIPLFVWLPDAMAGPTPVSALIHAATMVTAGVYMITRLSSLYIFAPTALVVIATVGACTALLAATIALVQNDIKKVLAYSTVSQLGYMFMALGAGAFSNGIYHVVTHAFFKACLFMGAGSVIVGCHHEQDMRHFGGLRKFMPITFATYLAATYAITGLPWGAGFFSKDALLWSVYSNTGALNAVRLGETPLNHILWGMGLFTAFLTAFYMTRSLMLTFFGTYRGHHEPHETPWTMTLPLILLAIPSLGFGFFFGEQLMAFLGAWGRADLLVGHEELAHNPAYHVLEQISILVAVVGVALAAGLYGFAPKVLGALSDLFPRMYRLLLNKWWIDELYDAVVVRPLRAVSTGLFRAVDRAIIDGLVNGAGVFVVANGEMVRRLHTGKIGAYASGMLLATLLAVVFWMVL